MIAKEVLLKELAKLEQLNWAKDDEVADTVFPYVLIEAMNYILNSTPNATIFDYAETSDTARAMLEHICNS